MTTNNMYLGANELVIVFRNGRHHVIEEYANWEVVFSGHYEQCVAYCENREIDYLDSLY